MLLAGAGGMHAIAASLEVFIGNAVVLEVVKKTKIYTTAGIRWWSPTQLLISRSQA